MVPVDRGVCGQVILPTDGGAFPEQVQSQSRRRSMKMAKSMILAAATGDCPGDLCDQDSDACSLDACESVGPWIINGGTGWFHLAVVTESGRLVVDGVHWGLACRPRAALQASCFLCVMILCCSATCAMQNPCVCGLVSGIFLPSYGLGTHLTCLWKQPD